MSEQQGSTATQDAASTAPTSQTETPGVGSDLQSVLSNLDRILQENPEARKELRSHRTLMGIAGDLAQGIAQRTKAESDAASRKAEAERVIAEMERDASENPEAFAQKWLQGRSAAKSQQEIAELRETVKQDFGTKLGAAVAAIPEFKELSQEEVERISAAMVGKPEDEVLAAYAQAVVEAVAEKKAAKKFEAELEKRIGTERKAIRTEEAAKLLKKGQAPSMRAASSGKASDEPAPGTKDWDRWYESKYLGRRSA